MKHLIYGAAAALSLAASAPSSAVTLLSFNLGGGTTPTTNMASLAFGNSGVTLTATARQFTALPTALTQLSDTTGGRLVSWSVPGIGVSGGVSQHQLDTNFAQREALLISGSQAFSLQALTLSAVDDNDTLQIYGVNSNGSLVSLGFPGIIRNGLGPTSLLAGEATGPAFQPGADAGTQALTLVDPTNFFSSYLFTTRVAGAIGAGQGYRLNSLLVDVDAPVVVPEPESWALLIVGFGLIGVTARRRRTAVSA